MSDYDGFVQHIEFDGSNMSGEIPTELENLQELKYLDLSSNNLEGEVPLELSRLKKLRKYIFLVTFLAIIFYLSNSVNIF